jgi:hypothetical protein
MWYPPAPAMRIRQGLSPGAVMTLLGLLIGGLLFTGLISYHAIFLIPPPGSSSFPPSTTPEVISYVNTVRALGWISIVAMDLAVGLTVMIAFIVGGMKGEVSDSMRRGIFIFASVFPSIWVIFSSLLYAGFRLLPPFG